MKKILNIQNVEKSYRDKKVLNQISFDIYEKEFVCIMGVSGSGKTTLLNCISTVESVDNGHIILDNTEITYISEKEKANCRKDYLGFIMQDFALIDCMTIEENIALPLILFEEERKSINSKVSRVMKQLDILNVRKQFPQNVSGGQKQRCACCRAIVKHPKLLLADEPTGALDSKNSQELMSIFEEMNKEFNMTILMVTHDVLSACYSDRVLFLKDGRVVDEIEKKGQEKKEFLDKILQKQSILGGKLC